MSLSDDIKDIICNALPSSVHCEECDREVSLDDALTKRDYDNLASDILQAVNDWINK